MKNWDGNVTNIFIFPKLSLITVFNEKNNAKNNSVKS